MFMAGNPQDVVGVSVHSMIAYAVYSYAKSMDRIRRAIRELTQGSLPEFLLVLIDDKGDPVRIQVKQWGDIVHGERPHNPRVRNSSRSFQGS